MSTNATEAAYAAETRGPEINIGTIVPFALVSVFVFARAYSRAIIMRNWGWDDTFIIVAWIFGLLLVIINYLLTVHKFGHHQRTITLSEAIGIQKVAFYAPLTYQLTIGLIKISICFFNLRIFQDRLSKRISYAFIAWVTTYTVILFFLSLVGCIPIHESWSIPKGPGAHCLPDNGRLIVIYTSGAVNIATDVALLIFVVPKMIKLQMNKKQKVALLTVILSTSTLVIVATIIRMVQTELNAATDDFSWNGGTIAIWTGIEVMASLFCASAPTIKPLIRRIAPGLLSSISGGASSYPQNANSAGYRPNQHMGSSRRSGKKSEHATLDSQNELDDLGVHRNGQSQITNSAWRGNEMPLGDAESEKAVLNGADADVSSDADSGHGRSHHDQGGPSQAQGRGRDKAQILKTVSVTVADSRVSPSRYDASRGGSQDLPNREISHDRSPSHLRQQSEARSNHGSIKGFEHV